MIYCSSDDELTEEQGTYSTFVSVRRRHVKTWSVDIVNDVTLLRGVEEMQRIRTCMYYSIGGSTYLSFYLKDELLYTISFLRTGAPKIWYFTPSPNQFTFEALLPIT